MPQCISRPAQIVLPTKPGLIDFLRRHHQELNKKFAERQWIDPHDVTTTRKVKAFIISLLLEGHDRGMSAPRSTPRSLTTSFVGYSGEHGIR